MVLYRIRDWAKHFENSRTRELVSLNWVPIPNRMDGSSYTELVDHKDGAAHYGVWVGLVLVASRCQPRGDLMRASGNPHTFASISRVTGFQEKTVESAVSRLMQIRWLESFTQDESGIWQHVATLGGGKWPLSRMEGNGKKEGKEGTAGDTSPPRFTKPTLDEVSAYCRERGRGMDPERFVDFYESKGWKVGDQPMKDWKAAVRNWEKGDDRKSAKSKDLLGGLREFAARGDNEPQ